MVLLVNYSVPLEQIRHTEQTVSAFVESTEVGSGTIYVTENFVLWLNSNNEGIQLEYKQITLHAISRDLQAFPKEHILVHYEGKLPGMTEQSQSEDSDEGMGLDSEADAPLTEIRFAPENKDSLEALFEAIADCQALHPDDDCQLSEDDDFEDAEEGAGDGFYNDEEGFNHLNEEGRANLERFNQMLQAGQGDAEITARTNELTITNGHPNGDAQDGQFQDADDDMGNN